LRPGEAGAFSGLDRLMPRKDRLDGAGWAGLVTLAALFAFNQIIITWVNKGLQPVAFAGIRSLVAIPFVLVWLALTRGLPRWTPGVWPAGLAVGLAFAAEFLLLFLALDLTTVGRAAILFYSMPLWFALMAHWGLPGERLTAVTLLGLAMAFAGAVVALLDRSGAAAGQASLTGDLCALGGAIGWALTAFFARRPGMAQVGPEVQLLWMLVVSGPVLLALSPLFGPLVRDLRPSHLGWMLFQAVVVVAGGFIAWLWLLSRYPVASVASFSFLTPVISLVLGWAILDEPVGPGLVIALALVAAGIVLINRRPPVHVPTPVQPAPASPRDTGEIGRSSDVI
jgi:drug/metabolite transporter (DMT)-like permease